MLRMAAMAPLANSTISLAQSPRRERSTPLSLAELSSTAESECLRLCTDMAADAAPRLAGPAWLLSRA